MPTTTKATAGASATRSRNAPMPSGPRIASSTITTGGVRRFSRRRRSPMPAIAASGSTPGSFSSSAHSALRTLL
jgi:hypothetical protein